MNKFKTPSPVSDRTDIVLDSRPRRVRRISGLLMATTALVGLAACSAPAPSNLGADLQGPPSATTSQTTNTSKLLGSSGTYSLTQTVVNSSDSPLTLQGLPTVDNGGAVSPGYPTIIQPNSSGVFKATNTGNGVQMWLHFTTPGGAAVVVDSDVPKVDSNKFQVTITGPGLSINTSHSSIGSGDNATAATTLESCTSSCTTTFNGGGRLS